MQYNEKITEDMFDSFPRFSLGEEYYLREPTSSDEDADGYYKCYNDPKVNAFIPDDCIPRTIDAAKRDLDYLRSLFERRQSFFWLISKRDTNEVIGNIGYHEWNRYHNRAEISYELRSDYWRRGIMSSACKLVVEFAFEKMMVSRLQATTVTENVPSINLLQKVGFLHEGLLKQYKFYKNQYVDISMFGYSSEKYKQDKEMSLRVSKFAYPITPVSKPHGSFRLPFPYLIYNNNK